MSTRIILVIVIQLFSFNHLYAQDERQDIDWFSMIYGEDTLNLRSGGIINNTGAVGSPSNTFSVTPTGGASLAFPIEVPMGVNGVEPEISIVYNSQRNNGLAGWGGDIIGISSITRGPRDIYHDGKAYGMSRTLDDAFFLDGQRLIEKERIAGCDSAVFYLENNPYIRMVLHGLNAGSQSSTWFSVQTNTGMSYIYGGLAANQEYYTSSGYKTNAWYLKEAHPAAGNTISYTYMTDNHFLYPAQISYGTNTSPHFVCFEYESRPDSLKFSLEGVKGAMGKRLKSVTTKSGSQTYRKYTLTYDQTGDASTSKYSRLVSVTEENGNSVSMNPITMEWDFLPSYVCSKSVPSLSPSLFAQGAKEAEIALFAADLNGDGLTDIVEKAREYISGHPSNHFIRVYHAENLTDGSISFQNAHYFNLGFEFYQSQNWCSVYTSPTAMDIDGDGINELIVPCIVASPDNTQLSFYIFKGGSEIAGMAYIGLHTTDPSKILWCASDFNNDGLGEIAMLEKIKEGSSNYYGSIIGRNGSSSFQQQFRFSLPKEPRHILSADMDCDGLADLVVFFENGYSVFHNDGTWLDNASTGNPLQNTAILPSPSQHTTSLDPAHVWSGDFNGDGITDFLVGVYSDGDLHWGLGNGDGTLSFKVVANTVIHEQSSTTDDNDKMNCQVFDMDGDGNSDVVITKTMMLGPAGITHTYWFRSDGESLIQQSHATSIQAKDGLSAHYISGDFNGDGLGEIASLSYDCYSGINANEDAVFRIYKNRDFQVSAGKINTVTDGYGKQTQIVYKMLTDTCLYKKGTNSLSFPVIHVTPAIPAVATVTESNGASGSLTVGHTYEGLKIHVQGRGLIGMTATKSASTELGTTMENRVTKWHHKNYLPVITTDTRKAGTATETKTVTDSLAIYPGTSEYVLRVRDITSVDFDGNITREESVFQPTYGKPLRSSVYTNDGKQSDTYYTYGYYGWQYLPINIEKRQSAGNSSPWDVKKSSYSYNSKGLVTSQTECAETPLALTTTYTYDSWGNVLSATSTGSGLENETVTTSYLYDTSSRFPIQVIERGYIRKDYTYDNWGNKLTETDKTRSACPQTTTYTYDGWNNLTSATSPLGVTTNYSIGWGTTAAQRYFTLEEAVGSPWVKTWYDETGRKTLTESAGLRGIIIREATGYNIKGETSSKVSLVGSRQSMHNYEYDTRNRMVSDRTYVGGSNISNLYYSYGNRSRTTTHAGRTYTDSYDSWGNIIGASDPVSSVSYTYGSNGKPASVTSEGATVSMEYDDADNQKKLVDPDAGTQTYTYDALGRIKSQTDGRGITTTYTYNNRGQLSQGLGTNYTYGTGTNNNGLLLSMTKDGYTATYQYDSYGRMTQETRTYGQGITRAMSYTYNSLGQLATRTFPNQLTISYQYDDYGFLSKMYAGSQLLYEVTSYNGLTLAEKLGSQQLTRTTTFDNIGQPLTVSLAVGNTAISAGSQAYSYDYSTGNLTSRSINGLPLESFTYDSLDRLTAWSKNSSTSLSYSYDDNGNILTKDNVGVYYYGSTRPHAVTSIVNTTGNVPVTSTDIEVYYNNLGKAYSIEDYANGPYSSGPLCYIDYGPDGERWETSDGYYFGDYEERFTGSNGTQHTAFTYLDGGVLCVTSPSGTHQFYYMQSDNIGSIFQILSATGSSVFSASYDPWGMQEIQQNSIGFYRGFTGHEMLNDFGLINMNGRLYDPINARFLSPDNYVQQPWNSQNFNRYSYCLNNPLKYLDADGEFFWATVIVGAVIGGFVNLATKVSSGQVHNFWQGLAAFGVGAAAGGIACGSGAWAFGALGGAAGGAGGFLAGAASGALGSAASLPIQSWGNHWAFGDKNMSFDSYLVTVMASAAIGGTMNGLIARNNGKSFWSGELTSTPQWQTETVSCTPQHRVLVKDMPSSQMVTDYTPNGYPPNNGSIVEEVEVTINKGSIIQRSIPVDRNIAVDEGRYFAPAGTDPATLSLAPGEYSTHYYYVNSSITANSGVATPWFGQVGLGTQYRMNQNAIQLINSKTIIPLKSDPLIRYLSIWK